MPPMWFTLLRGARGVGGSPPPPMTTFHGALVQRTTAQTITTSAFIEFETALFDTDSFFDLAHPTRFTIPTNGVYMFGANIELADMTSDSLVCTITRSGDALTLAEYFGTVAANNACAFSGIFQFTAGDIIECSAGTELDATMDVVGGDGTLSNFWIYNYS